MYRNTIIHGTVYSEGRDGLDSPRAGPESAEGLLVPIPPVYVEEGKGGVRGGPRGRDLGHADTVPFPICCELGQVDII